ncbi:hypothetical protein FACS1894184_02850 [Clostridia bacterium]|nr:hypothetical protein FACS1894184_02850 [Clostridia bacterium]
MRRNRLAKRLLTMALLITLAITLVNSLFLISAAPALADGIDPPISAKWGSFSGRFPVTVMITDCKRLNLRSSPALAGSWNIVAYPARGTELTATGRSGDFIQVQWQGKTLYGYAAYLTPINDTPLPVKPPITTYPPWELIPIMPTVPPLRPVTPVVPPIITIPSWPGYPSFPSYPTYPSFPGYPGNWPGNGHPGQWPGSPWGPGGPGAPTPY